jgi:hypothetical protein
MIKEQTLQNLINLAKEYAEFVKTNFVNHEPELITLNNLVENSSEKYKNRIRVYQHNENVAVHFGNYTEFDYHSWDKKVAFIQSLSDAEFKEIFNEATDFFFLELPSIIEKQQQENIDNLKDLIEKKQKELNELQNQLNK